ncbi:MAG TPA: acyl-CoA thioesterase [Bacteroidia bacterium]|nr:acyl-CoA thioesterase [Bacteroidia bacterium]
MESQLKCRKEITVRFSEVDSLRMVWHGNYIKYFEDGREEFAKQFGLGYLETYANGYLTPIVKLECDYKKVLSFGETVIVETTYVDDPAAKIIFEYQIFKTTDQTIICSGKTIQVFLNLNNELQLNIPEWFEGWKKKWLKKK